MFLCIIVLPLFSSLLATNRYCGSKIGPILSVLCKKLAAIFSLLVFYEVAICNAPIILKLGNWVDFGSLLVEWSFLFDTLTVSMFLPIVIISFLIQIYSLEYMGEDIHKSRFFSILSLFAFTMLLLVSAENLLLMFVGWEGVGIVSYLLVNFWYTRIAANKASLSALFMNKLGDWGLILAIVLSLSLFNDLSLGSIFSLSCYLNSDLLFILILCFLLAGMAKSAMIGLHTWLPKAMEGPTSVSALLHSSTMVTAGVFLLIRISPILEFSSTALNIIIWLGALGALFGAACGLITTDLKAIIAMSTMSQLGYMIVAVGCSQYSVALMHLFTHAFFKSLLFKSAGCCLHALKDNQNINKMGGLNIHLPLTYLVFLFGSLSLMALPFTSGFYSKDFLLEILLVPYNFTHTIGYIFTLLAAFLTTVYSSRTMMIAFLSRPLFSQSIIHFVKDSGWLMNIPILILSLAAVMIGYLVSDLFISFGSTFYMNSIFIHPASLRILDAPFANSSLSLIPVTFVFCLFTLIIISGSSAPLSSPSNFSSRHTSFGTSRISGTPKIHLHSFTYNLLFLNHFNILNHWFKHKFLILSNLLYRFIDKGALESLGPTGFSRYLSFYGFKTELFAMGNIINYALIFIFGVLLLVCYLII